MPRALILGHEGQDGRLMAARLREEGWEVLGWGRRGVEGTGVSDPRGIDDAAAVAEIVDRWRPEEVYHFAAHHHSSEQKVTDDIDLFRQSVEINLMSLVNVLQAVKRHSPDSRVFYAASSRVFGTQAAGTVSEDTPFSPACVYGITKLAGLQACRYYRARHGLHVSVGILFNHESALRPAHYLSKKIIQAAIDIRRGSTAKLTLGSLQSGADWSYAPDAMTKIRRLLQMPSGDDYVIATGEAHTVEEFARLAFSLVGLDWCQHVEVDPALVQQVRPPLVGDTSRFKQACGSNSDLTFEELIRHLLIDSGGAEFLV